MCGICGFTGRCDADTIAAMASALVHRGPDEDGFLVRDDVCLGMRRLAILDIATGHQPLHNEDETVWTVFNGEIYDFPQVRDDLEARGHRFYTDHSDTELIVHAYEEYGLEFPHHINGMFAVALWDAARQRLVLVRDRMGVKPLFYAEVAGQLVFGSEIKAILAHPAYRPEPEPVALYHYLSLKNVPAPLTAFKGIRQLLPGEMLVYEDGEIGLHRWWRLRFEERPDMRPEEAEETIRELLDDATRIRMRCDVPFGAYLSGGVDSSTVVAIMARHASQPIRTFSLGYEDELANKQADLYHARRVAERFGTDHHEYVMSASELAEELPRVIGAFDQPFSGTVSTFFLSILISRHVKVALSGDGADELFGSYLSHRLARPMAAYGELRQAALAGTLSDADRARLAPCVVEQLEDLYVRGGDPDPASWRSLLHVFRDDEKAALLSDEFLASVPDAATGALVRSAFASGSARDPLDSVLEMEWNTQLPDQVLAFVDFLSMAHSVEVRSPFLDYRLAEFVATIPAAMKIAGASVKDILKRAVRPLLPEGITERPKEGFVLPVYEWMTAALLPLVKDVLAPGRLIPGMFREEAVAALVDAYSGGDRRLAGKVWNLVMLQLWWEQYFGEAA